MPRKGKKLNLYLNPMQIKELIHEAEKEREVIVIRCVRRTAASKKGGPGIGDLYDIHCGTKPKGYKPAKRVGLKRKETDEKKGLLTVFATNRMDPQTKTWGAWRRVNLNQVKKVIYKAKEYEVQCTE